MLNGFPQTLAYFREQTELHDLQQSIGDAFERSKKRSPVTHRIVVHPEFFWHPKIRGLQRERMSARRAANLRRNYGAAIRTVLRRNPEAIILSYPEGRAHYDSLPYDDGRAVETADRTLVGGATVGALDAPGMRRFIGLLPGGLHEEDRFVFDGATLNCCPTQTAVQVTALQTFEAFAPPTARCMPAEDAARLHVNMLRIAIELHRLFAGRMEMGVVGDGLNQSPDAFTSKLLTEHTRIYG